MKLRKQLFLTFAIASAVPLLVLWFTLSEVMYKKELNDAETRHVLIAQNLASALKRYRTDIETSFSYVAKNLVAQNFTTKTDTFISQFKFRHFCIANLKTGEIITHSTSTPTSCPTVVPPKRLSVFKSLANDRKPVFSPVMAGEKNQPIMYVLQIFGNKLAIAAFPTNYFEKLGKSISFGDKGHAVILDQTGTVLAHPVPAWVQARKNISKLSVAKRVMAGETGATTFYSPAYHSDMLSGFHNIKGTGWSIMIQQPVEELRAAARATHSTIFPIIAMCLLLSGAVALFIARQIMKPLDDVIEAATAVERGDHNVAVDVNESWHVPHEFKNMQKRFNAMAKSVSEHQNRQNRKYQSVENDSKRKTEYFSSLAHELKTPLNSILGFSSVLKEANPGTLTPHEETEFLDHIEKSAKHLLTFVNDLLNFNRLDVGVHVLKEQKFYLIDPIRFCETTLRKEIEAKNVDLLIECPDKEIQLFADERSINQIMINLVGNAVRYSFDKGQIRIITGLQEDGSVRIDIKDNGIGIPSDDLEEILQPFKRANDPQLADIHGTGLGLSIVSKLVQLHDMTFEIKSEHGFSTTASLIIPKERVISDNNSQDSAAA